MKREYLLLKEKLIKSIEEFSKPKLENVEEMFDQTLKVLAEGGRVSFGEDYRLGGDLLEYRVKNIFRSMGFRVDDVRKGFEDGIIKPQEKFNPNIPLVLEIKSSKKDQPARDDLRELDDWVFELSGEEEARKKGLGGGFDTLAYVSHGMISQKKFHPSPHKGVFIFNGSIEKPFTEKPKTWIGHNELEFAKKRNFCLMSFETLINIYNNYQQDKSIVSIFWEKIHSTQGEFIPRMLDELKEVNP